MAEVIDDLRFTIDDLPGRGDLLICNQINEAIRRQQKDGAEGTENSPALGGAVIARGEGTSLNPG